MSSIQAALMPFDLKDRIPRISLLMLLKLRGCLWADRSRLHKIKVKKGIACTKLL
jgi:hypothetical protein